MTCFFIRQLKGDIARIAKTFESKVWILSKILPHEVLNLWMNEDFLQMVITVAGQLDTKKYIFVEISYRKRDVKFSVVYKVWSFICGH